MSLTGYIAINGTDLSLIFQPGNSGVVTGYKLSSGNDIGSIFASYTSTSVSSTGLVSSNGSDLNALFNGIPTNSLPLSISGCCLWLDANDSTKITKDASNKVSTWTDKSPNAFSFTQSTATYKPVYTANSQNGKAVLAFTASNTTYLAGPSNFAIGTSSFSLFVVASYASSTAYGTIFAKSLYGAQTGRFFILRDNIGFNICYFHSDSRIAGINLSYTAGSYQLFELIVNRTEGVDYAFQNGSQVGSLTITDTTNYTASSNLMLVGAYNNGSGGTPPQAGYYLTGNVAEILGYKSSDMTIANRQRVEGYLAWKWGIYGNLPSDHPYKNSAPT